MNTDKIFFNDLLSRLDTLHDFCDPSADRNKDNSIDKSERSDEFANVFKPEILTAMDNEQIISKLISNNVLTTALNSIIDRYITDKSLSTFYKNDLENLIDRTKNGLTLVSTLRNTDKETYDKTSSRISSFEPSVVAFYEFLYNVYFQKDESIGKFISNKYLPIFDFVNGEYKYVDTSSGIAKYTKYTFPAGKDKNYEENKDKVDEFLKKCVDNKENIIALILGKIDDDDKADVFLNGSKDVGGFYKFDGEIRNKKERAQDSAKQSKLQEIYLTYLQNLRVILGKYFGLRDDNVMVNLIVDTTNFSFSKYYKELDNNAKAKLKIRVLCNVAMRWDGANSPECQKRTDKGELEIKHQKNDKETIHQRAIYDIDHITLKQEEHESTPDYSFDNGSFSKINPIPREVGQISECIRQQINKKRRVTTECRPFSTKGRLLDLKRTGDALQALMAKQLNDSDSNEFYVFVTLDHLAFLKARIHNIPTIYTSIQRDGSVSNRVLILFNSKFTKNHKSLSGQLSKELDLFTKASERIKDDFPIIIAATNNERPEMYFKFYLLLDYLCRLMFGIIVFIRPHDFVYQKAGFLKTITNSSSEIFSKDDILNHDQNDVVVKYLKALLSENYNLLNKFQDKWKFQYHKNFKNESFLGELSTYSEKISSLIDNLNNKITTEKNYLIKFVGDKNIPLEIPYEHGLIDKEKIKEIIEKFIINSFIIECFYTIKRVGIFREYLKDIDKINTNDVERIIKIFKIDPKTDETNETNYGADYSNSFKSLINYLDSLRLLNTKYQCFTASSKEDIILGPRGEILENDVNDNTKILARFFESYRYNPNHTDDKVYLNKLFGFKYDEYKDFIDSLEKDINSAYIKNIKPKIEIWREKFNKTDYFKEPVRKSRTTLSVAEKMEECKGFFKPANYNKNIQELFYNKIYNKCENFYKNKITELSIIKITNKPIPFEKAVEKITKDELILRTGGNGNIDTNGDINTIDIKQIGGQVNEGVIANIIKFFECDLLYNESSYSSCKDSPFGKEIRNSSRIEFCRTIWKKYKYFIIDIWNTEYGNTYFPVLVNISEDSYKDWNLPNNIFNWKNPIPIVGDIIRYIVHWGNLSGRNWNETGVTIDMLEKEYGVDLRLFIFDILVELLTQTIDKFYLAIEHCYSSLISRFYLYPKGDKPIQDILIWMMINDPAFLFYHPNRKDNWSYVEEDLINFLWKDVTKKEGGGKPHPRPHFVIETKADSDSYASDNTHMEYGSIIPNENIENPSDDEAESSYRPVKEIDYSKYVTKDECLFMKCVFDKNFLLMANLGLLSSIKTYGKGDDTFGFKDINLFNPDVIESKRIERDERHPFTIQELRGGFNKHDINKKMFSLADYHQKYYKPYYNIYYKN
jgi:hypothetical protein